MAWHCPIAGSGRGYRAAREALRLSPRDPFAAIYRVAADCQYVGNNYYEPIRLCREALRERSDFVGAHRVLTAATAMAGRRDVAKAALQDLRVVQPNISLGWIEHRMPFERDEDRQHYLHGFKLAGLNRLYATGTALDTPHGKIRVSSKAKSVPRHSL